MQRHLSLLPILVIVMILACSLTPGYNPAAQHVAHLESLSVNPASGNGQFTLLARYTPGDDSDGLGCTYTNLTTGTLADQFTVSIPAASGWNYSATEASFDFTVTDPGIFQLTCYTFGYKQALGASDEQSVDFSVSQVNVSSNVPGILVAVVPVEPPAPIAAKDFAALNASLEQKIAALNQAELKFIHDMQATSGVSRPRGPARSRVLQGFPQTEQDLKDLAGKAMDVAILSDQLSELTARQDKGSDKAAQSAEAYTAIARTAFSLVIDAQDIRHALMNNLMPGSQAIEIIAQYGMQLWSTSVTEGSTQVNPFAALTQGNVEPAQSLVPEAVAQVQAQMNAINSSIWIAQSATPTTRTLTVPAAQSPVSDPFDQQSMNLLTTAAGQEDGDKAQQVAAANLQRLGATASSSNPTQEHLLQVPSNPVAVSGREQIQAGNIPTFQQGTATVVSKENPDEENAFMQTFGLAGKEKPSDQGRIDVYGAPDPVHLSIASVEIKSVSPDNLFPGLSNVNYSVTVHWITDRVPPQFTLDCLGDEKRSITQESGAVTFNQSRLADLSAGNFPVKCVANHGELGMVSANIVLRGGKEPTLVFLEISNVVIKSVNPHSGSSDHQDVNFSYMVNWTTNLVPPEFRLVCVGGERNITQAQGALMIEGSDTRYISDTVTINCTAWHYSKETGQKELGHAEVDVPIGAAQAQNATATFTSTVDAQATAFALQTSDAVATEVSGTQTAEFQMTAAAAETARAQASATPPPVFTMNGTFGISRPLDPCDLSTRTSGTVNITVDLIRGSAAGQLTGSGSQTLTGLVCQGVTYDVQCSSSYTGNLTGSMDGSSGALQLAGQLSGSNSCVFTNCQQNGRSFDCPAPQGGDFSLPVTLKGTVNLSSRTGKGIITSPELGEGDWHAGE